MTFDQTHWIPVQQRRPLPTFYYHEHFMELLDFVGQHYAHVLLEEHVRFIEEFRVLPREAQCLYVRLVNRKGRVFARNRIRYPELGEIAPLFDVLLANGWATPPGAEHFKDVLGFLTRAEIYAAVLPHRAGVSRSLKKADLVGVVRETMSAEAFMDGLDPRRILVQRRVDEVRYLLFLYFGRIRDGLSQFTMRDLGLVRTQSFHDTYEPRFVDREEAAEHYYFATRLDAAARSTSDELAALAAEVADWPEPNFPGSATLRDELAAKLGRRAERATLADAARAFYAAGESAQCSERFIRLLLAQGDRDAARRHLERCLDDPRSDEEWLVARDLYEQKFEKKRTSALTDVLRAAETIDIDESRSGSPERAVVEYFEGLGLAAYRTENLLWRTLFGLLLWDELFVDGEAAVHSPFEFLPASLANGSFYDQSRDRIEAKLALLSDPAGVRKQLLRISTGRYGTPNGVFRWRRSIIESVFSLLDKAPPEAVAAILRRLCTDYADSRYGYPDLMVVDAAGVRFVEVKTEGDQLRRNQLLRLEQLRAAGFRADVVRVRWVLDPGQAYVVVDVETTGGRGEHHRVTEVGAVKVRGGEIVDRFQTLLNPQRNIPANIVRLTGISPAMVEDAPYFADIADEFEEFLQDAIFVAHNVEFDYGFIAAEFRRLGRLFRFPRLCTCASMRRLYPGHRSYSLAALCREFDIPLRQHHRALCDAEAAAELLLLINEKRQQG
ncbi:MAG TPA: exonuclease domain-containing protein [Woeseiaceae bacterium]|nr:exonuclease domain-containing protein [Woeseiaceae bacterium]